jgi:hypothetical protein
MVRSVGSCFLVLCVLANGVDAALDVGAAFPGHGNGAHEAHDPHHDDPDSAPGGSSGEPKQHFCHCAAHAPALSALTHVDFVPVHEAAPEWATRLAIGARSPPPVRPPKA